MKVLNILNKAVQAVTGAIIGATGAIIAIPVAGAMVGTTIAIIAIKFVRNEASKRESERALKKQTSKRENYKVTVLPKVEPTLGEVGVSEMNDELISKIYNTPKTATVYVQENLQEINANLSPRLIEALSWLYDCQYGLTMEEMEVLGFEQSKSETA